MAIDKNKCDPELGKKVYEYLKSEGVLSTEAPNNYSLDIKKDVLKKEFTTILKTLGMNMEDGNLIDTPRRLAKLWTQEMFWGLDWSNFPKITTIDSECMGNYNSFVLEKSITGYGCCSHHFLSMVGIGKDGHIGGGVNVAYIPKNKVIGLSKLNRVVQFVMARPGTEEQYCKMVALILKYCLDCDSVAVMMDLKHLCVAVRGATDGSSSTLCYYGTGAFQDDKEVRKEFFAACK